MVHPEDAAAPYLVHKAKLHTIRTDLPPYYKFRSGSQVDMGDDHTEITQSLDISEDAMIPEDSQQHCQKIKCPYCGEIGENPFDNLSSGCVQGECQKFWHTKDGKLLGQFGDDGKPLRYSKAFLKSTETIHGKKKDLPQEIPQIFQPLRPSIDTYGKKCWGTEKELRGGFTCPKCYCCNSQRYWDRLQCKHCGFTKDATPLPYPMKNINEETKSFQNKGKPIDGTTVKIEEPQVHKFIEDASNGSKLFIYMLTKLDGELMGTLVVERPNEDLKKAPCGADELLNKIQAEGAEMRFQRNPAVLKEGRYLYRVHNIRGTCTVLY